MEIIPIIEPFDQNNQIQLLTSYLYHDKILSELESKKIINSRKSKINTPEWICALNEINLKINEIEKIKRKIFKYLTIQ